MSQDDNIVILRNPDQKYWVQICEEAVIKNGWINSEHDYKAFQQAFPDENFILLVAVEKETDSFVGSVCVATYTQPEPLSAVGMYLVKPEYRGKGIGMRLFDAAIEVCAPKKFLYGVENMMSKYRDKYGFSKIPEWYLTMVRLPMRLIKPLQLNHDPTLIIKSPIEVGWDAIVKYYKKFLPDTDGSMLIKALLEEAGCYSWVALTNENRIVGLVRLRETYAKELAIGPLLGNDTIAASTVLRHALCHLENLREYKELLIQFPNTTTETLTILKQLYESDIKLNGMKTFPQFTDRIFELPTNHIYAVSQNDIAIV